MKSILISFTKLMVALILMLSTGCGSSVTQKTQTTTATSYANSALLVSTSQLAASLDSANQVVIDVRSSSAYGSSGHIRNAVNLPPGTFDKGGTGIDSMDLKSAAELATILGNAGISINTKIIVCGQNVDASAGRVFWMLEYLGAKDVHMLDGGYDKWVKDGYPTVTVAPTVTATTFVPAVDSSRLATKASVLANYNNAAYVILDSRNAADYNPGYIPNAINVLIGEFLNADNTVKSYDDLTTTLESRGITPGKTVITYCYVGYRSGQEYFILRLMGYDVSNYDGSYTEWNADPTPLPKNSRPNGNLLISGESLAATIENANQAIIDVRSSTDYAAGHIRNAVNLPPGTFDKGTAPIDMDLKSQTEIAAILGAAGVSESKKIIVYGKSVDAGAGRVFWMLEYLGATDVQVLDGGYDKWVGDGRATATTATAVATAVFTPASVSSRLATKASVLANYTNTSAYAVLDSRDAVDYGAKHIPNALNILIGEFLNADGTVQSYTSLKALLDGRGVTTGKTVITYCYVGYRSGQEYLIARLMGFNVSNYDGSWTEWSADPTLPTAP